MPLTPYGFREWLIILVVGAALAGGAAWFGWWWATGIVIIVMLALLSFFRDPIRRVPTELDSSDMLSPADGTVSKVETVEHHEAVGGPAVIVRIFLSVLNVHVNRSPCDGVVQSVTHRPGQYFDARTEASARFNESNLIVMKMDDGTPIGIRQVSGAVARRIVCPIKAGDRLSRGKKFGMIKFGSTTELILPHPEDVKVHVVSGDRVKGGLTILATAHRAPAVSPVVGAD